MTQGTWRADLDIGDDINIRKGTMDESPLYEGCDLDAGDFWLCECDSEDFDTDPANESRKLVPKERVIGVFFRPDEVEED